MSGCLIALKNHTGVRPVGVGGTWRGIFAKCVLKVTETEATIVCQYYQLCAVLKSVIDGDVHGVQDIWGASSSTDNCIFLLVDGKNTFNEINRIGIIWKIRHLWPSRAHLFLFHCYRHW